jgi:hypothetical protein
MTLNVWMTDTPEQHARRNGMPPERPAPSGPMKLGSYKGVTIIIIVVFVPYAFLLIIGFASLTR